MQANFAFLMIQFSLFCFFGGSGGGGANIDFVGINNKRQRRRRQHLRSRLATIGFDRTQQTLHIHREVIEMYFGSLHFSFRSFVRSPSNSSAFAHLPFYCSGSCFFFFVKFYFKLLKLLRAIKLNC